MASFAETMAEWASELQNLTKNADDEAEKRFPDDERDNSKKNAFRHALGTGRLAQMLGADNDIPVVGGLISTAAQGAAKGAGYLWEAMGAKQNMKDPTDMKHDLNANAHGAEQAAQTRGYGELADRLELMARSASKEEPPGVFSPARKHLTYTK